MDQFIQQDNEQMINKHNDEIMLGERFKFGTNWASFLDKVDNNRINLAEQSLKKSLKLDSLDGMTFIDVGCGSGLFSLVARKLGATVFSFDYDPESVWCTQNLKNKYFPNDPAWKIEEGSILDHEYVKSLGQFDIVYSWGVLHHTGAMWSAISNFTGLVADNGTCLLAIYNDQGLGSKLWYLTKRIYNKLPSKLNSLILVPSLIRLWGPTTIRDIVKGHPGRTWKNYAKESFRGMSAWHDVVDWVGGYPFEVAKPDEIISFFIKEKFVLVGLKTCGGGHGCNEFVLKKK